MLSPVLEKKGVLGPTVGRRPGDVTIPIWSEGKGLAIDVAVTSPLLASSVRLVSPCETYATNKKHGKYDLSFEGAPYLFCAMVWETLGAINEEGEDIIRQVFRFAARRLGCELSSFCGRAWARVSCCLQALEASRSSTASMGVSSATLSLLRHSVPPQQLLKLSPSLQPLPNP
jgi:hypothetical protein